ncbi:serine/threonine-protein kinase [Mycobacterium sp.]|uniref:serine/threonine-protein kinase n=1 Tax=Mycobacterium sp. TaxID=1785 RepID=UPI0039C8C423
MDGTPFGRYRLVALLGRGGQGEVWRAFDTMTERVVALKLLPERLADDEVYQERFRREARSAAGLNEPHVVPIYDFGEIDGRLYVTMRLIEGRDLQSILGGGPLEPARAVHIIDQIASALNAAHRINLVHRDVKPSNILVAEEDFAYLIDFGIARGEDQTGLTTAGTVIGTLAYLAPERVTKGEADARSDIYSLACVMHECLTGEQPFPGRGLEQQVNAHLSQPPPRPSAIRPYLPAELDAVIGRGMAKNPDARYETTKDLAYAARAAITAPPARPEPAWPVQPPPPPPQSQKPRPAPPPPQKPRPAPPARPVQPAQQKPRPAQPVRPAPQARPGQPARPGLQALPAQPTPPARPQHPKPAQPAQPAQPAKSAQPAQTSQPAQPEKAEKSDISSTAPTQLGPILSSVKMEPASSPAIPTSSASPSGSEKQPRKRRGIVLVSVAAAVALLVAAVVVLVVTHHGGGGQGTGTPSPSGPTSAGAAPNSGPFTGVYRADFGPSGVGGKLDQGATPSTGQWSVRSACGSAGCVATATVSGGPTLQSTFVLDDFDGQWHAVGAVSVPAAPAGVSGFANCTFPAEYWTVITLQARPDGSLVGQYRAASQVGPCITERTVTFTRTGDVDTSKLPDPATQAPRVASPAEAWHGRYHGTRTPQDNHPPASWDSNLQTDCLRTGERCVSYDTEQTKVYIFADGKWLWNFDGKSKCNGVQEFEDKSSWELPLPQPPQDPITLLTGHGHRDVIGSACARSYNENVKFERTGD